MHKWRRFFRRFITTHIVAFEERQNGKGQHQPAAHATIIRSSVKRYFKYAGPDMLYVLAYDPLYEEAINELRKEGWIIRMEIDSGGELYYGICAEG